MKAATHFHPGNPKPETLSLSFIGHNLPTALKQKHIQACKVFKQRPPTGQIVLFIL